MVLRRVLEDLLDGAGRAGGVDDAALGDGQQDILPQAVEEVLGDVRRERRGRLVPVEPRRDAQAAVLVLRILLPDLEGRTEPTFIPEGRRDGQDFQGVVELFDRPSRHPGAEVRGFHGTRTTAGSHELAFLGERLRDEGDAAVGRVGAQLGVTAHDGDHLPLVEPAQELPHRIADGPVMHRPAQGFADVVAVDAFLLVVGIDPGVEAAAIGFLVLRIVAGVQALAVVQLAPERIVDAAHPGEDQAGVADVPFHLGGNLAAEEAAVGEPVSRSHILRDLVEVDVLERVVRDTPCFVRCGQQGDVGNLLVCSGCHRPT